MVHEYCSWQRYLVDKLRDCRRSRRRTIMGTTHGRSPCMKHCSHAATNPMRHQMSLRTLTSVFKFVAETGLATDAWALALISSSLRSMSRCLPQQLLRAEPGIVAPLLYIICKLFVDEFRTLCVTGHHVIKVLSITVMCWLLALYSAQ